MILSCVAVRLKSTRCPNKAVADLYHKPLIYRLTERIQEAELPGETIWCTSTNEQDQPLAALAIDEDIPYLQGSELDVMGRFLNAANYYNAEHIVRITGDNPLTDPKLIDRMIERHLETETDYTRCLDAPRGTRPEIIRVSALKELYKIIDPNGSEYMTYQLMLLENKQIFESGINRPDVRLTVDTPEDLALMQNLYSDFHGHPPPLAEIIKWYDARKLN